jgi:hypothetical protein
MSHGHVVDIPLSKSNLVEVKLQILKSHIFLSQRHNIDKVIVLWNCLDEEIKILSHFSFKKKSIIYRILYSELISLEL